MMVSNTIRCTQLEALEQQAADAWEYSSRGLAVPLHLMPKVPDSTRPFTITMRMVGRSRVRGCPL